MQPLQSSGERRRLDLRCVAVGVLEGKRDKAPKWGIAILAARRNLRLVKLAVVLPGGRLDAEMLGVVGLDEHAPRRSPRPARPATWVSSWNVRSAARKSGSAERVSAETTPTSVTAGKSRPLAIICVPTSTSARGAAKAREQLLVACASSHRVGVPAQHPRRGNCARTSSSTRSVPMPK